jgi:hypothetical protein
VFEKAEPTTGREDKEILKTDPPQNGLGQFLSADKMILEI